MTCVQRSVGEGAKLRQPTAGLRYPEATVRYGRKKCQDITFRPRVPPLPNVPDRRGL